MNITRTFAIAVVAVIAGLAGCETSSTPLSLPPPVAVAAEATPERDFSLTKLEKTAGELGDQLHMFAATAKLENRKPFVQFTAAWCGPCRELQASMNDPLMIEAFAKTFIIQINADDFTDKQLATAGFKIDGIPAFYELDEEGKPTGRSVDGGAWDDNIPRNMAPVLQKFFRTEKS